MRRSDDRSSLMNDTAFQEGAMRHASDVGSFLDLYENLKQLVEVPDEQCLDRVSNRALTVKFHSPADPAHILVSFRVRNDESPYLEYSFYIEGDSSMYEPANARNPVERFLDWEAGLRHLMGFLCMVFEENISSYGVVGSIFRGTNDQTPFIC
jgi:hypothetical protein